MLNGQPSMSNAQWPILMIKLRSFNTLELHARWCCVSVSAFGGVSFPFPGQLGIIHVHVRVHVRVRVRVHASRLSACSLPHSGFYFSLPWPWPCTVYRVPCTVYWCTGVRCICCLYIDNEWREKEDPKEEKRGAGSISVVWPNRRSEGCDSLYIQCSTITLCCFAGSLLSLSLLLFVLFIFPYFYIVYSIEKSGQQY